MVQTNWHVFWELRLRVSTTMLQESSVGPVEPFILELYFCEVTGCPFCAIFAKESVQPPTAWCKQSRWLQAATIPTVRNQHRLGPRTVAGNLDMVPTPVSMIFNCLHPNRPHFQNRPYLPDSTSDRAQKWYASTLALSQAKSRHKKMVGKTFIFRNPAV